MQSRNVVLETWTTTKEQQLLRFKTLVDPEQNIIIWSK